MGNEAESEKKYSKGKSSDKEFSFAQLVAEGNMVIEDLIDHALLTEVNNLLLQDLDLEKLQSRNLPGFKMGNLAIDSCDLHIKIWDELKKTGLIEALTKQFEKYRYVSFGGNLNLPGSKTQRHHIDSVIPHLTINVPLVNVSEINGAVSVVDTNYLSPVSTFTFFKERLYRHSKRVCSKKGDIILRFASTWHRGNENRTQDPRMMLSYTLREDWPWSAQEDKSAHLISQKSESKKVSFSGNIYPDSRFGMFIERFDYYVPKVSMGIQHLRNMLKLR